MSDKKVYAGKIWVRKARRKIRIRMEDRKRIRSFKQAVKDQPPGSSNRIKGYSRNYRNEFLTLDARNKLITSELTSQELRNFTKLEIKERLFAADIPVPLTFMTLTNTSEIPECVDYLKRNFREGFVIKPNDGHSGRGIAVVNKVVGQRFITTQDEAWDNSRLNLHLERILRGRFSRGRSDVALIEERIQQHYRLRNLATYGLVDFRLIVSHGYPVMGMARLPTRRSRGKGNLHRGALGMGISLHEGVLTSGIHLDKPVTHHPDTGYAVSGVKIPNWYDIVLTGARAQYFSSLTYAGVDMVVNALGNVKVLEVNRRPGLAIQLANKAGLRNRLEYINELVAGNKIVEDNGHESVKARVDFAIDMDKSGWSQKGGAK